MNNKDSDNTYLLTKKDETKTEVNLAESKIFYWNVKNSTNHIIAINQDEIFKHIMSIGRSIDKLGNIEKLDYYLACKKTGGREYIIYNQEKKFIINALNFVDIENENKDKITHIEKKEKNNIIKQLKVLDELFGIEYYSDNDKSLSKNGISCYARDLIDFLPKIHILYEFNNIIESVNKNKICESKLWEFNDENNNQLNSADILKMTKYFFSELFNINPIIRYNDETNKPQYLFSNIIEVAIFKMMSVVANSGLNLRVKSKAKICDICSYIYFPTSNNQRFCNNCKKTADNNRQKKCRNKKSKRD